MPYLLLKFLSFSRVRGSAGLVLVEVRFAARDGLQILVTPYVYVYKVCLYLLFLSTCVLKSSCRPRRVILRYRACCCGRQILLKSCVYALECICICIQYACASYIFTQKNKITFAQRRFQCLVCLQCRHACMYVCMYACICEYVYTHTDVCI
jgi:hypothetical protein